jgi:hypothetical protein
MAGALIIILLLLYFFGYITIPGIYIPNPVLFTFGSHPVTLATLLIFLAIMWAIEVLPSPLRQIAVVAVLLWLLSTLGFIALAGLSNILVIAILIGLVISLFL